MRLVGWLRQSIAFLGVRRQKLVADPSRVLSRDFSAFRLQPTRSLVEPEKMMVNCTTPGEVTHEIRDFCRSIDPTASPCFVDVKPAPDALPRNCFYNTKGYVAQCGGSVQYGWIIWEAPSVLLEAEFHAVWRDPEGKLLDVTPKEDGETRIVFLPDRTRVWGKELIPNIRRVLNDSPECRKMLERADALFEIRKRNWKNGKLDCEGANRDYAECLARERTLHDAQLSKVGRNDPCFCGSGKKFKKCCGRA
jgi:hypothetical protein